MRARAHAGGADASAPAETMMTGWDCREHMGGHSRTSPATLTLVSAGSAGDERSRQAARGQPFEGFAFDAFGEACVHGHEHRERNGNESRPIRVKSAGIPG